MLRSLSISNASTPETAGAPHPPRSSPAPAGTVNSLSHDVEIKGTVSFDGSLYSDGRIEGDVISSGTLAIGENGSVVGDISASVLTVRGRIEGNVSLEDHCELGAEAELIGDLVAPRLIMEEGATFIGQCRVGPRSGEIPAVESKQNVRTATAKQQR